DVAHDQSRFLRRKSRIRKAQPAGGAGGQVLHDDVGVLEHQSVQDRLRLGMLYIERQAFLAAVGPHEVRCQPTHALVVSAREVADAGSLDLDDACAEVGELARRERRSDRVLERDDGNAGEWSHWISSVKRSARSRPWRASL